MLKVKLNEYDDKLVEIHSALYPCVNYGTTGATWFIKSCDYYDEEFKTYKEFISFIRTDVTEALLTYAMNGELTMLAEALGEEQRHEGL